MGRLLLSKPGLNRPGFFIFKQRKCNQLVSEKGRVTKAFELQNSDANTNYPEGVNKCHKN
jgi:hypothetical protein